MAKLADLVGATVTDAFSDEVTHLVTDGTKEAAPTRTLKLLQAMLHSVHVLTFGCKPCACVHGDGR